MKILLTAINAKYIHSNLAVYSLRAYAKEYRESVELAEYTINQRTEAILREIYKRKPDVLCFSCYIWNIGYVRDLAAEYHKLRPDVPIWLGGPEVSYETETFLRENPYITGVIMGEGEEIFRNMCRYYCKGDGLRLQDIPGIAYRNGERICINPPQLPIDMSTIPFPYADVTDFAHKIVYYESSRGCPFRCSYCLSSLDKKLRFRDMELVKRELAYFLEQKVPQVKFVDRTFNCDSRRAMEIWKFLKENDNGITNFHFEAAADLLTDEELAFLKTLRPGLIQLEIGVQTTNPDTIKEIHRSMDLSRVKHAVTAVKAGGNIHQHLDLIAGLPYEGYERFTESFDEIYDLQPQQLQLGFLKVLKGSYVYDRVKEYGLIYTEQPPYEVLATKWLSYEELQRIKLAEEMLEVYYNSGQFLRTIRVLKEGYRSAFQMFYELGCYYEDNGYLQLSHTRNRRLEILLAFAWKIMPEQTERLKEAAVYDIYERENAKSRPQFAPDLSEWKELSRKFCKKGKLQHLERFYYEADGSRRKEPYYILFDYEKKRQERIGETE